MKLFMVLLLAFCAGLSLVSADEPAPCPQICPMDHRPICAVDADGIERTFSNPCVLSSFNCAQNKDFVVVRKGLCSNDEH